MIEIAICDDDPTITGLLERTLQEAGHLLPEPLHIRTFYQGEAALAAIKQEAGDSSGRPFDIIFLDIELGDTTGIAVAEQIRSEAGHGADRYPTLVFVSAYESYCKQLFQFDAAAFLSKPIDRAEVKAVLLQAYKKLRNPRQVFVYQFNGGISRIPLGDILYFESRMHKIEIVTKNEVKSFYGKIDEVEAQLRDPGFVRIHHSMLVNLENAERLEKNTLSFSGGRTLPLARGRQKEVRQKIMDYYRNSPNGILQEDAP
jgi:DNA-binding LytR/AlgR family response regulator